MERYGNENASKEDEEKLCHPSSAVGWHRWHRGCPDETWFSSQGQPVRQMTEGAPKTFLA